MLLCYNLTMVNEIVSPLEQVPVRTRITVKVIGWLTALLGIVMAGPGIFWILRGNSLLSNSGGVVGETAQIVGMVIIVFGLVVIGVGFGVIKLKRWAFIAMIAITLLGTITTLPSLLGALLSANFQSVVVQLPFAVTGLLLLIFFLRVHKTVWGK